MTSKITSSTYCGLRTLLVLQFQFLVPEYNQDLQLRYNTAVKMFQMEKVLQFSKATQNFMCCVTGVETGFLGKEQASFSGELTFLALPNTLAYLAVLRTIAWGFLTHPKLLLIRNQSIANKWIFFSFLRVPYANSYSLFHSYLNTMVAATVNDAVQMRR